MSDIEARYVIPPEPEQRALYKQAYKRLDITQGTSKEMDERLKIIENVMVGLTPEQKEEAKRRITKMRKRRHIKPENENCPDGEHCEPAFKEIGETELLTHLQSGWRIEHNLQNGNVIVCKG